MSKKIEELRELILTWLREVYSDYYDEDADREEIKPLISAIVAWHNKHQSGTVNYIKAFNVRIM